MEILNHVLSTIDKNAPVDDVVRGLYWTAVVSRSCGLSTLINHTLEGLLPLCPKGSFTMLLRPSTPMTNIMLDHAIDMISGSLVIDQSLALTCIKQGANFRQLKRSGAIRLLTVGKN